jgi:hypothetical protein
MGSVTPTITDLLHSEQENLARFRRALRREDQIVFDSLFAAAYKHRAAAAHAGHLLPFETFLLSMQLENHKEILHLREEMDSLRKLLERMAGERE